MPVSPVCSPRLAWARRSQQRDRAFETYAIASAIIGGTSFFGGKGRIPSVVVGGLIIGTISNGLNMLQIQTFYQLVVMGSLIIAAVTLDRLIGKTR